MLLKELIMKKKKNAILKSQIQQYEKLLNEIQKEDDQESQQEFNMSQNSKQAKVRIRSVKSKGNPPQMQSSQVKTIRSNNEEQFQLSKNGS